MLKGTANGRLASYADGLVSTEAERIKDHAGRMPATEGGRR